MTEKTNYRKGSIDDLQQLRQLAILSYGQFKETLSVDNWKKMESAITNEETFVELIKKAAVFVCVEDKLIIGVAYLIPNGNPTLIFESNWSYIRMVSVHPHFRGRKIAKQLTQTCIDYAKKTGEKIIALHTAEFMDAARHIYENIGFKKLKEVAPIFGKRYWVYQLEL